MNDIDPREHERFLRDRGIATLLYEKRIQRRLSVRAVALHTGYNVELIEAWENGRQVPSLVEWLVLHRCFAMYAVA